MQLCLSMSALQLHLPFLHALRLCGVRCRHSRRIMFVACGTSFNACLASRQTVEDMCDVSVPHRI